MVLRDIEDADVFDNDMSHASLDEFKQLYDDDKNRIKQKSIEFLSNFGEMLVGWKENPVAITTELEFEPWRDAHDRGYVAEIERFLGKASGTLIPEGDPTKEQKQTFKSLFKGLNGRIENEIFWSSEDEDVHLYHIIKENIGAIKTKRRELLEQCHESKSRENDR
eukprot:GHVU01124937.1.p1 GENE.GHVU01124937.1~~GHVU01124937.1.p1  ORF type:complete len:165 (+),score=23.01 GHVU01124937.1:334-828(+)